MSRASFGVGSFIFMSGGVIAVMIMVIIVMMVVVVMMITGTGWSGYGEWLA